MFTQVQCKPTRANLHMHNDSRRACWHTTSVAVAQLAASQLTETAAFAGSGLWLLKSWSNLARLGLADGFELVIAGKRCGNW